MPAETHPSPPGDPDAEVGEALEAAARAEERAEAARARAARLRREAQEGGPQAPRRRLLAPMLAVLAVLGLCALSGASGYLLWQHRAAEQQRQLSTEYAAAARQGVVNLMSLDFNSAREDVQRVIDNATGKFRDDFQAESGFLISALQESKVVTEVTVNHVAVESMTDDSAVVLVSSKSQATNSKDARQQPQLFRIAVTLTREGDQLKVSQVDFV